MLPRLAFRICIDQRADHALIGDTPLLSCALEELYTAARQPERHLRRVCYGMVYLPSICMVQQTLPPTFASIQSGARSR